MWKALVKKQFLEWNSSYIIDKKTGKKRSVLKLIGLVLLFIVLFGSIGFYFYTMAMTLAKGLLPLNLGWVYFSVMILVALLLGVFGTVFHTYATLYNAKDNDLLLSLPIPVGYILSARLLTIFITGLLYEGLVYIPTIIAYIQYGNPNIFSIVTSICMFVVIAGIATFLTCILGWVIAQIASRIKRKNFVIVFLSVLFFVFYYYFIFNYTNWFMDMVNHILVLKEKIQTMAYPLYALGMACDGSILHFIASFIVVGILLGMTYTILSKTFLKVVTKSHHGVRMKYKERKMQRMGVDKALLKREWTHLLSSPTYLLNAGIGIFLIPIAAIAVFFMKDSFVPILDQLMIPKGYYVIILTGALCMMSSMIIISAPSVSLEGKSIWIVQSLPVSAKKVLHAKFHLQDRLSIPVLVFSTLLMALALQIDILDILLVVFVICAFSLLMSRFGLMMNLLRPNLEWTNETAPVKQSLAVTVCLFGGWIVAALFVGLSIFLYSYIPYFVILIAVALLLFLFAYLCQKWIDTKGCSIFERL